MTASCESPVAVLPGAGMPAQLLAAALRFGWRPALDCTGSLPIPVSLLRRALAIGARSLSAGLPAPRVAHEPVRIDTDPAGRLIGEWARPSAAEDGAIVYFHGGAYAFGSPRTHRVLCDRLAADARLPVLSPDYRLAPEHPFPGALEDALAAYEWVLARGIPATRVVVAGDSAGGHLAATAVCEIARRGLPAPAGVILLSPWVDLSCELSRLADGEQRDPLISPAAARRLARLYVGTAALGDPRLDPRACLSADLPPFLIQAGGRDALRGEASKLAECLTAAGVACQLQVWPGQIHVFQLLNRFLPAARAALGEAARFAREQTGATDRATAPIKQAA